MHRRLDYATHCRLQFGVQVLQICAYTDGHHTASHIGMNDYSLSWAQTSRGTVCIPGELAGHHKHNLTLPVPCLSIRAEASLPKAWKSFAPSICAVLERHAFAESSDLSIGSKGATKSAPRSRSADTSCLNTQVILKSLASLKLFFNIGFESVGPEGRAL